MGSKIGTALAAAILGGSLDIVSQLLEHGADVTRVGGCYSTASGMGMYPSALDVAHSEGSIAGPILLALHRTTTGEQNPDVDPVINIISRPLFPMPYTPPNTSTLDMPQP